MLKKFKSRLLLFLIFLLALSLRLYGLNWDQNQHLHPDERFLTMVTAEIKFPSSISQYLDTNTSTLNPFNYPNYHFFVYGTFPIFLTKFIAHLFNQDTYDLVNLWGRGLSAIFDSFNIILLFLIFKKISKKLQYLPSLIYCFAVLPLQLSHFFTVDIFLSTFVLATFTLIVYDLFPLASLTFGLALASKITAIYFFPIILIFFLKKYIREKKYFKNMLIALSCLLILFLVFRFFQPYSFIGIFKLNPLFIESIKTLQFYNKPNGYYPPSVYWLSKTPLLFSIENYVFWGLGIPLSLLFFISIYFIVKHKYYYNLIIVTSIIFVIYHYFYQGSQFTNSIRYYLYCYPFICLIAGFLISKINTKLLYILLFFHFSWGILFLTIYSRPNPRIQASDWIYQNIPINSVITSEYWDDALPLNIANNSNQRYQSLSLSFYDSETTEKWNKLDESLSRANFIIMSSSRLWGSITKVPNIYPITTKFYQDLFSGKTNFQKIIGFSSYPGISLNFMKKCLYLGPTDYPGQKKMWITFENCLFPGIYVRDDTAEESFTVFDHPQVLIYKKLIK